VPEDGGHDPFRGTIVEQVKYIQNPDLLFGEFASVNELYMLLHDFYGCLSGRARLVLI
jgi:hypothetical protein